MKFWVSGTVVAAFIGILGLTDAQAESIMDPFLENTLQVEATDGTITNIYFNADGTYHNSKNESGTWTLEGDSFCSRPNGGEETCNTMTDRSVGDSWSETDPEGNQITLSIIAGRLSL